MENENENEDLAGLSEEERAALEDDDGEAEIIKGIAGDDDDDDDQSGAGNPDAGGAAAAAAADDGAAADDAAAKQADADDAGVADPGPTAEFQPEFKASVPDGLDEKITALDTRADEVMDRFKGGEIEMPEFIRLIREIDNERLHLTLAQKQAEWAKSQNDDNKAQRWVWEQERFFAQEKASIYKDPILHAAITASVNQLNADPANAKKPFSFFLDEADRQVRQRFNVGGSQVATAAPAKPAEPDLSKLPKTLANLPSAEISETGGGEFAYLEKLLEKDPMAYEAALGRLTPEQEARFLGVV